MGSNYYPWGPHGPQSDPNAVTPNPTPSYSPPASSGWDTPSSPSYGSPVSYGGGGGGGYAGPTGPRLKSYFLGIVCTMVFGPFGLFYASKKGALIMLLVLFGVPITLGALVLAPAHQAVNPLSILDNTRIMNPMWSVSVFCSVIWSIISVRLYNKAQKASKKALAELPTEPLAELPKVW